MIAEPNPKKSAIKRRQPREELVDYFVAIKGWDWSYSLSVSDGGASGQLLSRALLVDIPRG